MQPDDAIKRYKERRVRDAQAPVGATDFDELDASDSDAEESDDDILGAGATTSKMALPVLVVGGVRRVPNYDTHRRFTVEDGNGAWN